MNVRLTAYDAVLVFGLLVLNQATGMPSSGGLVSVVCYTLAVLLMTAFGLR